MRWPILIPLTSIVAFTLGFSVVWWAWQRRREREAYYRHELSRLMLERYADTQERVFEWLREQEAGDLRRRRELLRLTAWILLLGGAGALAGLGFTTRDESLFGWVPIGVAAGLFVSLLTSRERKTLPPS